MIMIHHARIQCALTAIACTNVYPVYMMRRGMTCLGARELSAARCHDTFPSTPRWISSGDINEMSDPVVGPVVTANSVRAPPIAAPSTVHVAPGVDAMSYIGTACRPHVVYSLIESNS